MAIALGTSEALVRAFSYGRHLGKASFPLLSVHQQEVFASNVTILASGWKCEYILKNLGFCSIFFLISVMNIVHEGICWHCSRVMKNWNFGIFLLSLLIWSYWLQL